MITNSFYSQRVMFTVFAASVDLRSGGHCLSGEDSSTLPLGLLLLTRRTPLFLFMKIVRLYQG